MTTSRQDRLIEIIREKSFQIRAKPFGLKSKALSNLYFNTKPVMFDPESSEIIGDLMAEALLDQGTLPDAVGGLAVGAVPLASIVPSGIYRQSGEKVDGFYVLKEKKEHGITEALQGLPDGKSLKGLTVAVLEDVTTTGGSAMEAVEAVRAQGGTVTHVLSILNRGEGADELFAKEGLLFTALTHKSQFVQLGQEIFHAASSPEAIAWHAAKKAEEERQKKERGGR